MTPEVAWSVSRRDGNTCQYCGVDTGRQYSYEHVIPKARGGVDETYNIVISCRPCNAHKNARTWVPANIEKLRAINPEWALRIEAMATPINAPPRKASRKGMLATAISQDVRERLDEVAFYSKRPRHEIVKDAILRYMDELERELGITPASAADERG